MNQQMREGVDKPPPVRAAGGKQPKWFEDRAQGVYERDCDRRAGIGARRRRAISSWPSAPSPPRRWASGLIGCPGLAPWQWVVQAKGRPGSCRRPDSPPGEAKAKRRSGPGPAETPASG